MAKINMPKKEDDVLLPMGQKKPQLHRDWLQVDRQTKSSYETATENDDIPRVTENSKSRSIGGTS